MGKPKGGRVQPTVGDNGCLNSLLINHHSLCHPFSFAWQVHQKFYFKVMGLWSCGPHLVINDFWISPTLSG